MKIKGLTPVLLILLAVLFFTGHIYFLAEPLANFMNSAGSILGGPDAIGWSIILLTVIVRLLLLPIMLHQSRNMTIQQEKMRLLQPQLRRVQEAQKTASTQEEKMLASQAMMTVYRENNVSLLGGMNFAVLIVQWPIFSGLYGAINPHVISNYKSLAWATTQMTEIKQAAFFGISLSEKSLVIAILTGVVYFVQSYLSIIGVPEETRKQMKQMMFMMPIMMFFMTYMTNAGVGLYFFVGALVMIIQTLIINAWRPRLRKGVEASFTVNDVVEDALAGKIETPQATGGFAKMMQDAQAKQGEQGAGPKDITDQVSEKDTSKQSNRERNAGKQKRN
ncbi:MAG: membrane protein insertase YidC [Lactobacillaceae bacterium]|jgi:YidC/Oxa1 family membrane protein insertase|nr:membrane protein insertase YidC [Lactobacillaceae bacterium]